MYYVYTVRCADGSYYTGLARHLCRRMHEHTSQNARCARYTRSHAVVSLDGLWRTDSRSTAAKLECAVKRLSHAQKEALLAAPDMAAALMPDAAIVPVCGVTLAMCLAGEFQEEI